jgi:2-hydroxychromene-2-carboxylate isomerase
MSAPGPPRFFFGAMSPYSWFAAERIDALLPGAQWRGVFAGAVFKANGRMTWGLTDERERRIADCERRAAAHGLGPMRWPDPWPTSDVHVARAMAFAEARGELRPFALAAMRLSFLEARDLGEPEVVVEAARRAGIEAGEMRAALGDEKVKDVVRATVDEAVALGVFGVPTVVVGEELFWGDDRLEEAASAQRAVTGD